MFDQPTLVVDGGPDDGKTIPIGESGLTLGRLPENQIVVNEPGVSRKHAEIGRTDSGIYVRDLGSTNGTFVNNEGLGTSQRLLKDGDEIRLASGESFLVFRDVAAGTVVLKIDQPIPASAAALAAVPASSDDEDEGFDVEIFEGNVRLKVLAEGDLQYLVHFVQQLREQSQLRVLRLVSNSQRDVDILLGLREPLRLREVLGEMDGVSQVEEIFHPDETSQLRNSDDGLENDKRAIHVRLAGERKA